MVDSHTHKLNGHANIIFWLDNSVKFFYTINTSKLNSMKKMNILYLYFKCISFNFVKFKLIFGVYWAPTHLTWVKFTIMRIKFFCASFCFLYIYKTYYVKSFKSIKHWLQVLSIRGHLVCIFLVFILSENRKWQWKYVWLDFVENISWKYFQKFENVSHFQYSLYVCRKHFQLKMRWYNGK